MNAIRDFLDSFLSLRKEELENLSRSKIDKNTVLFIYQDLNTFIKAAKNAEKSKESIEQLETFKIHLHSKYLSIN